MTRGNCAEVVGYIQDKSLGLLPDEGRKALETKKLLVDPRKCRATNTLCTDSFIATRLDDVVDDKTEGD